MRSISRHSRAVPAAITSKYSGSKAPPQQGLASCLPASQPKPSLVQNVFSRVLPGDLWGAASVLSSAAADASGICTKAAASAAADFSSGAGGTVKAPDQEAPAMQEEKGSPKPESTTLRERLDFKPRLSPLDNLVSVLIPGLIGGILYWVTKPAHIGPLYATGMAMICAAWLLICRAVLLERQYTARLVPEAELADKDSHFAEIEGIRVHFKSRSPARERPRAALHCFHGFGANTGSWSLVHSQLAEGLGAQVSAHDMPGFGLTQRPTKASMYSLEYNGSIGMQIMQQELSHHHAQAEHVSAIEGRLPRIFLGHSLGAACAAAEAVQNPKAIDALILVAPAIMAFGFLSPANGGRCGQVSSQPDAQSMAASFGPEGTLEPPVKSDRRPKHGNNAALRVGIALAQALLALGSGLTTALLQPVTTVMLRSAVRRRAFWERGLGKAWFDKAGITPDLVDLYRQPQLVRGWEKGLIRFAAARMSGGRSLGAVLKDAWSGNIKPTQAELLAETVQQHNIKVLIVHGESDALVPVSNSRRLVGLLPNARLVVMPQTGHMPHEEHPEDFTRLVRNFLSESLDEGPSRGGMT